MGSTPKHSKSHPTIKRYDMYKAVRRTGASKEKAARIANTKPSLRWGGKKGKRK